MKFRLGSTVAVTCALLVSACGEPAEYTDEDYTFTVEPEVQELRYNDGTRAFPEADGRPALPSSPWSPST